MMLPTIFDILDRLAFLRGYPAAYLVLAAAVFVLVLSGDWRLTLFALWLQYLLVGLLFVDVLDPRLAVVKVLVGLFVCLILYMTARQVNWGRLPEDVTPEEAVALSRQQQIRIGPYALPTTATFRLFLALMIAFLAVVLTQQPEYRLPIMPPALAHVNLAVLALMGIGLLTLGLSSDPLPAGVGMLLFSTGFELYYSVLDQSITVLGMFAAVHFVIALVIAYLTQVRHAIPALFD